MTGSTGFVGSALYAALRPLYSVVATSRYAQALGESELTVGVGDLSASTQWAGALENVDCLIHLAGRAHILGDTAKDQLSIFRRVNVDATLNLARQASEAGVRRFIFVSSVGVHGNKTQASAFDELSPFLPHADYAVSKMEAEIGLRLIADTSGMELVILRPPLVYSGHAPGNFGLLLKLVSSGLPLPFGGVKNQRSMIALDNLVDLILLCVKHPSAANQDFLVSDGVDVSTPQIIQYLAAGMERKIMLFSLPESIMYASAFLVRRLQAYHQLSGSLRIDSIKARSLLGWTPLLSPSQALLQAGRDYMSSQTR